MTGWEMLFSADAALWFLVNGAAAWNLRHIHRLPAAQTNLPPTPPPSVTVILAARDEEERIENTLRHLLEMRDVDLEIVVIDDRSTDRTPEILDRVCRQNPRVHRIRVDTLPDGWLGKCHACHLGAAKARGHWLLFTDADCWIQPDVLHRAIQTALRERADHLALTPGIPPDHLSGMAWHCTYPVLVANWLAGVNRDRRRSYGGVGAFNLLTREAYQAVGGHERLRLTVVDDVKLGLLLRRAGRRTRVYLGGPEVECHWGHTAWSILRLTEKNCFAMVDYRIVLGLGGGILPLAFWLLACIGPFQGSLPGWLAWVGLMSFMLPAARVARRLGWSPWLALLTPFLIPILPLSTLNSTVRTLWRGGVRWRDTFYPLALLRAHNVRR